MTPTDIQRLRALAENIPVAPRDPSADGWYTWADIYRRNAITSEADAVFIAACDPATVIALCDLAEKAI